MTATSKKKANPKKEKLIELSIQARDLRDSGEIDFDEETTINAILIEYFYSDDQNVEFNTFKQWKQMGATIVKGSESFPVWGQPRKALDKELDTKGMTPEEIEKAKYKFWPMCHLFSNAQVVFPSEAKEANKDIPAAVEEPAGELILDDLL